SLLVCVSIPLLAVLLVRERRPTAAPTGADSEPAPSRRDWTRGEVLRNPHFYAVLPGVLAAPLVVTGLFFNQATIAEAKGWALTWFAAAFPVLAALHVLSALAAGWMVDRFGARRLLPVLVLPLALATL